MSLAISPGSGKTKRTANKLLLSTGKHTLIRDRNSVFSYKLLFGFPFHTNCRWPSGEDSGLGRRRPRFDSQKDFFGGGFIVTIFLWFFFFFIFGVFQTNLVNKFENWNCVMCFFLLFCFVLL